MDTIERWTRFMARILGVTVLLLALPPAASAQTESDRWDALRACLTVEQDSARLACFERIVRDEPTPAVDRPAAASTTPSPNAESTPAIAAEPAPAVAAAEPPEEPATSEARRSRRDRRRSRENDEARTVIVVEVRRNTVGEVALITDSGDVYMQTSGGSQTRYPAVPFEATLEAGVLGSSFLTVRPDGPRVRVAEPRD